MNLELGRVASPNRSAPASRQGVPPRRTTVRVRLFVCFVLVDMLCLLFSFGVAPLFHQSNYSGSKLEIILAAILPIYLFAAINSGAYASELIEDRFRAVSRGLQSFVVAIGIIVLAAFALKTSATFSRLTLSIGATLSMLTLAVGRYFFARHAKQLIGGNPFSVVVLCDGEQPEVDNQCTLLFAADGDFDPDRHDPDMYDRLAKALESADRVVVACNPERRLRWASALKGANIQAEILMPEFETLAPLGVGHHGDQATLVVSTGPLKLGDRLVKRAFDTAIASLALLFFSPLLIAVAILIRLDSRGPIFFQQTRIGRGNEKFRMLKFRSMAVDKCDGHGDRSTARDDDRITRVGRVIRATSIDELPQLFNVLKGDMSIVGPRPHALGSRAEDKLFWEIDQRYWHRHAAKPGLTGLAQVRGYRGATHRERDLVNRLQADLEYLDHWSIWKDLTIILQTFRVLLHRNAY